MLKCPKCGNTEEFIAQQVVRMGVRVDGNNYFIAPVFGKGSESTAIYDSEEPYGPYFCVKCKTEFDK